MTNPHSPTGDWLRAVCDGNGYDSETEPGDVGRQSCNRDGETYDVIVIRRK